MSSSSTESRPSCQARIDRACEFVGEALASGAKTIWIVASSNRSCRRLTRELTKRRGRLIYTWAFTAPSLAREVALPQLVAKGYSPLPPLGSQAIAATTLADCAKALPVLAPFLADFEGLRILVGELLLDLRANGVEPAELQALAGVQGTSGREGEVAQLVAAFQQALERAQRVDTAELFRLARSECHKPDWKRPNAVLLLDPEPASAIEAEFLVALTQQAETSLTLLPLGTEPYQKRLLDAGLSAPVLPAGAAPTTNLQRAQQRLFQAGKGGPAHEPDPSLTVRSEPEAAAEAAEIARQIGALGRAGVRYDQIAVLLPASAYLPLFQEALARADLPSLLLPGPPVPEPVGRTLRILLRVGLEGGSVRRFLEALSLGQMVALTEGVSKARLERLLTKAGVVAGDAARWDRRLALLEVQIQNERTEAERDPQEGAIQRLDRDLEVIAALRKRACPLVERLCKLKTKTCGWREWSEDLRELVEAHLAPSAGLQRRLEELEHLDGLGDVDLRGVLDLLDQKLGLKIDPPDADRGGRVTVMPVRGARGCSYAYVFAPGMVEGAFPSVTYEDPVIFDATRLALRGPGFDLRTRARQEERDALRVVLDSAEQQLFLTFPRLEPAQNREPVPSSYVFDVLEAAEGWRGGLKGLRDRALPLEGARLDHPVPEDPQLAAARVEYDLAIALATGDLPHLKGRNPEEEPGLLSVNRGHARERLKAAGPLTEIDGFMNAPSELAQRVAALAPSMNSVSATALERFGGCPYAFFLHHVVGLRELDEPELLDELNPLLRGNLIHRTVQQFLHQLGLPRQLRSADLPALLPKLDVAFDDVTKDLQDAQALERPVVIAGALADARRDLHRWLRDRAEEGDQGWTVVACEIAFGLGEKEDADPNSDPEPVDLAGPPAIKFLGQIDLVEERGSTERRITDLKTGSAWVSEDDRILGGQSLQRVLYALAYAKLKGEAPTARTTTARLTYLGEQPKSVTTTVDPGMIQTAQQALQQVVDAFAAGFFPAVPSPRVDKNWRKSGRPTLSPKSPPRCSPFCPYLPICGPQAARRAKQKLKDPRLAPLHQLRSTP